MKARRNTVKNKERLLKALFKHNGVIYKACEEVGLNRGTFHKYYNVDPDFKQAVDDITEKEIDIVEEELHKRIKGGSDTAIIFYLKTKAKKRGYIERSEVVIDGKILNINVDFGTSSNIEDIEDIDFDEQSDTETDD
jgi:ACT domain-containing protein